MPEKNARTLSQPSNRVKPRDTKDKKVVFKGVLDSPYRIQWPSVPLHLQRAVLDCILDLLEGASDYHHHRCSSSKKRKRAHKATESTSRKKEKKALESWSEGEESYQPTTRLMPEESVENKQDSTMDVVEDIPESGKHEAGVEAPIFLRHLLYGINAITKRLETQTHSLRHPDLFSRSETLTIPPKPLKYIFVCRADVDPALLIEHLPHLVAAYNSLRPSQYAKLVPLPQGSESVLAQALGIRRVTVLGIDAEYSDEAKLKTMLEPIPILAASWLTQSTPIAPLIQTHIKLLRTTAPKDMKEAKELRLQEKAAAKRKKHGTTQIT